MTFVSGKMSHCNMELSLSHVNSLIGYIGQFTKEVELFRVYRQLKKEGESGCTLHHTHICLVP